ncbi:hypothetical protein N7476_005328 [Penicillium atrosanguineum]|uniref:Uncharacterized protein n=1 Tax=Penicillium atrosanguineum TaxID=1132637 RepID=A0A9W9U3H0_9EURO|nr:hypothetical protein N7476_005328 [Penicillium atrosanguineum]
MADWDFPMDTSSVAEGSAYPDIDETLHYPWQGQQSATDHLVTSVIDPRLYGGTLPQNEPEPESEAQQDYSADELSEESQVRPPDLTGEDDDSEFVYTEEDNDSGEEEDDEPLEDDDEDSAGARRRRRRGGGRFSGRWGARGGKGIKRGPRKPLEPGPEFKMYHSGATEAFIDGNYERATELVMQAIQVNPEMFTAHSLLSEIFLAQGQKDKALAALWNGAHTRPKVPSVWMKVARLLLERAGEDRQSALNDVIYCYSRVIEISPKSYNVRYQRAAVYRELGYNGRAAAEYERILKDQPNSPKALRSLAEIYIDLNDVPRAIEHWTESVDYYLTRDPETVRDFGWSDVNIYAELFGYIGQPDEGLHALKALGRWLLGRKDDEMWDDFEDDDREWDPEDSPRRIKTDGFIPGQWPRDVYGLGLPLELRIKMGLFRLKMSERNHNEALHHFEWLNPDDTAEGARIFDYGDLFREVADALKEFGLLDEALRFYTPIQETTEYADISYFMAMADCYTQLGKVEDAETCYLTVAEHDSKNMESRVELAKLYESLGMSEQAFRFVNEAVLIGRQETRTRRRRKDNRLEQLADEFRTGAVAPRSIAPRPTDGLAFTAAAAGGRRRSLDGEGNRTENIQFLYSKMQQLEPLIKEGDTEAIEDWLDIADALLRDFKSNRSFYPIARTMEFRGYTSDAQRKSSKGKDMTMMSEMEEMAGRLQKSMGGESAEEPLNDIVPTDYHGISFDEWLDIFLQYALLVTDQGEHEEAYETLEAADHANIWHNVKAKKQLVHVCWFTCAIRAHDEETLLDQARWFVKEYQFITDTYRIFAMLSSFSNNRRKTIFNNSASMKFMLRQIKAMDYTLPESCGRPNHTRNSIWKERASLSTRDEKGEPIPAGELDSALLVLYGHMLYSGGSFYPALNYFFRAYALDDQNPGVLLSIALSYINHSFKRQSENRHFLIMQGLSFMDEYRLVREKPGSLLQERQEMEFNFARVYHGLGLTHLAVEAYNKVLKLGDDIQRNAQQETDGNDVVMGEADQAPSSQFVENFSHEAAFALQTLHVLAGNAKLAKEVTDRWLVI